MSIIAHMAGVATSIDIAHDMSLDDDLGLIDVCHLGVVRTTCCLDHTTTRTEDVAAKSIGNTEVIADYGSRLNGDSGKACVAVACLSHGGQ